MKFNHSRQKLEFIKVAMVELLLPKNSRIKSGKNFKSKGDIKNKKNFKIYNNLNFIILILIIIIK